MSALRLNPKAAPSKVMWTLRPERNIKLDKMRVVSEKLLSLTSGKNERLMALVRVGIEKEDANSALDYSGALRSAVQQQRMRGLFEGLQRAGLPFVYVAMMSEAGDPGPEKRPLEFDLVVGTWADGRTSEPEKTEAEAEQRASVLSATVAVALPDSQISRLERGDLLSLVSGIFTPREHFMPQTGTPEMIGSLVSFEETLPAAGTANRAPDFYVPNLVESGRDGVLIGSVTSSGLTFHDLWVQLEDLKRHVSILGMTGSGKSTTGGVIVGQVARMGIPVLVLDWHNEYRGVIERAGGKVIAPGKDDFSINPIESGKGTELPEHIALVSDVFSDIYHFTHPQAFMFRNALQKRLLEAGEEEVPTLAGVVKTIEAYPLRSAYDNETKVALLRRLVPLTQGQAGKALGGPGTLHVEDLMQSVVCMELGHLRDVQTRAIFTDIMLKLVYEHKVRERSGTDHLTLVEEARNVAPFRRPEDPPSVGERMIAELRKFGESMTFIAQFPSQIASELLKNSGTKIVHRVAWPEDVNVIGASMSLSPEQKEHLTRLEVGEAVVSTAKLARPVLVQVKAGQPSRVERSEFSFNGES